MKNITVILFAFFLSSLFRSEAFAQNGLGFAPSNAEWWHNGSQTYGSSFSQNMTYANVKTDTVILDVNCKKIEREVFTKTRYSDDPDNILISSRPQKDLYVYDNADTVFVYNENFNRFTPLYIFNVNEGDTVMFARPGRRPQT